MLHTIYNMAHAVCGACSMQYAVYSLTCVCLCVCVRVWLFLFRDCLIMYEPVCQPTNATRGMASAQDTCRRRGCLEGATGVWIMMESYTVPVNILPGDCATCRLARGHRAYPNISLPLRGCVGFCRHVEILRVLVANCWATLAIIGIWITCSHHRHRRTHLTQLKTFEFCGTPSPPTHP